MYGRQRFNLDGESIGNGFVRLLMAGGACAGWYVSLMFSVMGFQAWNSSPIMTKLAYCTVAFFTALQLLVNHQRNDEDPNYGLTISGFVSYGFGIITNMMGILVLGGTTLSIAWSTGQWWQIALAFCLGLPLEIGPESLLMKAAFPKSRNMVSDAAAGAWNMLKNALDGLSGGMEPERPAVSTLRSRGGGAGRRAQLEEQYYKPAPSAPSQPSIRPAPSPLHRPDAPTTGKPEPDYHDLGDY